MTTKTDNPTKTLHRSDDRIIAGVCSGLGEYLNIDVTLVRVLAALLVLFGGGGIVLYVVAWLVMPDARGVVIARRQPSASAPTAPAAPAPSSQAPAAPASTPPAE